MANHHIAKPFGRLSERLALCQKLHLPKETTHPVFCGTATDGILACDAECYPAVTCKALADAATQAAIVSAASVRRTFDEGLTDTYCVLLATVYPRVTNVDAHAKTPAVLMDDESIRSIVFVVYPQFVNIVLKHLRSSFHGVCLDCTVNAEYTLSVELISLFSVNRNFHCICL